MLPSRLMPDGAQAVDWAAADKAVRDMPSQVIYAQIEDCLKTLPSADQLDREIPVRGTRGGFYRDELSVYRRELSRRLTMKPCKECGK